MEEEELIKSIKAMGAETDGIREGLLDLIRYLESPKFKDDTTVQVGDVLCRIREASAKGRDRFHDMMRS